MRLNTLRHNKLFVVFKNLVAVEAVFYLSFLALALFADWGEAYQGFFLEKYVRFEIIEFLLLGLTQLGLIFAVFTRSIREENDINEILKCGEHEKLEFKTSLRWDVNRNQVNRELEKSVMKTVAAFLNSDGGHLLIGVDDKGNSTGLDNDFNSLPKPNMDGFENHFNNIFNTMVGPEFRRFVKLVFSDIDGKTVCLANIEPSHKPVYLKTGDSEEFYIRTGNATTPLKMSEVATYVSSWQQMK